MMKLYRIAHKDYADLDGLGGLHGPGRWHYIGYTVVYLSESRSLAAWEKFVNISAISLLPSNLVLMEIEAPDDDIQEVPDNILISGWDGYPHIASTMDYGTSFLKENKHLLLKVPSAVIHTEYNYLLNPRHPLSSSCKIVDIQRFSFDDRLTKL